LERLRAHLKAFPDFDDVLAEERAMNYALSFPSLPVALDFFHRWPAHRHAAQLVVERHGEIDGNQYYLLDAAAGWLESSHPLAATLLRRAMIENRSRARNQRDTDMPLVRVNKRLHAAANLHHRGWIIARLRPRFSRNHGTAVLLSASVELQSQYIQSRP
jgi:hypothetical protein